MIIRDETTDEYAGVKCNNCDTVAPSAVEIAKGHGLINMGWYCSGGMHLCPDHASEGPPTTTGQYVSRR